MPVPVAFVSSTFSDLKGFRLAARDAVDRSRLAPRMMEAFSAGNEPPLDDCLKQVANADVVLVLVAHRFGWVPPEQEGPDNNKKSITWLECEHALKLDKEVLAFIVEDNYPWDAQLKESFLATELVEAGEFDADKMHAIQRNIARLADFKDWLNNRAVTARFTTPDDLRVKIVSALSEWRERHPDLIGQAASRSSKVAPEDADPSEYLRALRDECGHLDIRGLRYVTSGQAHSFGIDQLYIPLKTSGGARREMRPMQTEHPEAFIDRHLQLQELLSERRLVIIGDPGAGKTTFAKRLTWVLSRAWLEKAPQLVPVEVGSEADSTTFVPLFIRVSEFVRFLLKPDHADSPAGPTSPQWLFRFMSEWCDEHAFGLGADYFRQLFEHGQAFVMWDGLDEAPTSESRGRTADLIAETARTFDKCRFVVTTRPVAYREKSVLLDFSPAEIDALDDDDIHEFLTRWYDALFPEHPDRSAAHRKELLTALGDRVDIHRLARNPVMLTALGVIHWNERRLPEQRADLYESILMWLARSRNRTGRPDRPVAERAIAILQELALAMQFHAEGRQAQVSRRWAAEQLQVEFSGHGGQARQHLAKAEQFLDDEEIDSGIVVRRQDNVRFWHLTFQEFLAARAIAARSDDEQYELVFLEPEDTQRNSLYDPEWREMFLLLCGGLYRQGPRKVDALFEQIIDRLPEEPTLADKARCVALLGAAARDLKYLEFEPADPRLAGLRDDVMAIFDKQQSLGIPVKTAIETAEALGQAGDPRFAHRLMGNHWVDIPAGVFVMGTQNSDKNAPTTTRTAARWSMNHRRTKSAWTRTKLAVIR